MKILSFLQQHFVVLCLICIPSIFSQDGFHLDQVQSGVVTTFKIPNSGIWQSFIPGWTGNLTRVDFYLGAQHSKHIDNFECHPYQGVLTIVQGQASYSAPYFDEESVLFSAYVEAEECTCNDQGCFGWQSFHLDAEIAMISGHQYTVHLSTHRDRTTGFRIGLYVADAYHRGTNNFQAPGYDYAFKTYLDQPNPDDIVYVEDTLPPVQDEQDDNGMNMNMIYIIIGSVVAFCLLLMLLIVIRKKTRSSSRKLGVMPSAEETWSKEVDSYMDRHPLTRAWSAKLSEQQHKSFDDNTLNVYEFDDNLELKTIPTGTPFDHSNEHRQESQFVDVQANKSSANPSFFNRARAAVAPLDQLDSRMMMFHPNMSTGLTLEQQDDDIMGETCVDDIDVDLMEDSAQMHKHLNNQ